MTEAQSTHPTFLVHAEETPMTEEGEALTVVDAMTEIGEIALRCGAYSAHESITGIMDEHGNSIEIPFPDGTSLTAEVSFRATERSLSSNRISLSLAGHAPEYYRKSPIRRASVTLHGKPSHENEHILGIGVNKVFYPQAKDFEPPLPPKTETEAKWERYSPKTHYENKDGVDDVVVMGPVSRLRTNTLDFAQTFANRYLAVFRNYEQTHMSEANEVVQITETAI